MSNKNRRTWYREPAYLTIIAIIASAIISSPYLRGYIIMALDVLFYLITTAISILLFLLFVLIICSLIFELISYLGESCHHEWVIDPEDEFYLVCTKCGERHGMPYGVYRCH